MISVTVTFGNITAQIAQPYLKGITFNAIAGQNNYTASGVADLEKMVGKTLFIVAMDGSNLINGGSILATWDNTNFTLSQYITVSGGERITIIYI